MKAAGGGKGARLPESFLIALTPGALWVFTLRQGWTGLKVSKQLGALPRAGLRLWTADSKIVKRFALQATDGSAIAFEMNQGNFATTFATSLRAALPPSWSAFKDRRV
jgi:hypothetical protein